MGALLKKSSVLGETVTQGLASIAGILRPENLWMDDSKMRAA